MKKSNKIITMFLIVVFVVLIVIFLNIPHKKIEYTQELYTVSTGETLWSIAKKHCNNNDNIQEYIEKIKKLNNKNISDLQVNEKIIILIEK